MAEKSATIQITSNANRLTGKRTMEEYPDPCLDPDFFSKLRGVGDEWFLLSNKEPPSEIRSIEDLGSPPSGFGQHPGSSIATTLRRYGVLTFIADRYCEQRFWNFCALPKESPGEVIRRKRRGLNEPEGASTLGECRLRTPRRSFSTTKQQRKRRRTPSSQNNSKLTKALKKKLKVQESKFRKQQLNRTKLENSMSTMQIEFLQLKMELKGKILLITKLKSEKVKVSKNLREALEEKKGLFNSLAGTHTQLEKVNQLKGLGEEALVQQDEQLRFLKEELKRRVSSSRRYNEAPTRETTARKQLIDKARVLDFQETPVHSRHQASKFEWLLALHYAAKMGYQSGRKRCSEIAQAAIHRASIERGFCCYFAKAPSLPKWWSSELSTPDDTSNRGRRSISEVYGDRRIRVLWRKAEEKIGNRASF